MQTARIVSVDARMMAHDLLNGLMPLRSFFQTMDFSQRQSLEEIEAAKLALDTLIETIQETLHPGGCVTAGYKNPFSMWVRQVAHYSLMGTTINLKLESSIPNEAYPLLAPGAMIGVLQNLLQNASRAMGGEGQIEIVLSMEGVGENEMSISVIDHGCGMDEAKVSEIISGRSPPEDFHGYGLMSIRDNLSACGGKLKYKSVEGEGTEAILSVPSKMKLA